MSKNKESEDTVAEAPKEEVKAENAYAFPSLGVTVEAKDLETATEKALQE